MTSEVPADFSGAVRLLAEDLQPGREREPEEIVRAARMVAQHLAASGVTHLLGRRAVYVPSDLMDYYALLRFGRDLQTERP